MKCEKCKEVEATVYYAIVSDKGKVARKKYCRKCMDTERIRLTAPQEQQAPTAVSNQPQSLLDVVKGELSKGKTEADSQPNASDSPERKAKKLEQKMNIAVAEERYEDAAKIRDEIAALTKVEKPAAKPAKSKSKKA